MAKCIPRNNCLPFIMRLFLVLEVIIGALFIVFALVLQTPPKASVPIGLIIIGGLTIINSLFGCIGSFYKRSLLTIYLIVGTILTCSQAVLVFYMFGKPAKIASNIASYDKNADLGSAGHIRNQLLWVRWILLAFVIAEIVSLLTAFILRCCVDPDGHYGNFSDEEARYNTQMNTMPSSSSAPAAGKYESQSGSIASKYGMYKK